MDDYRESIWGINPKDRRWFQLLTLLGGTTASVILTLLELDSLSVGTAPSEVGRNIVLGIGASFVASGFIAWGLLQAKELIMPIGDWIREATARRRERLLEEGRQRGLEEGRRQGREEALREIYGPDYSGSQEGAHQQPPDSDNANSTHENGVDR